MNATREALAFAAALDRTLAAGPDDDTHDALHEISELCGGLSERGFVADLAQWLADEEGVVIGCDLSRRVEDKARWWIERAREEVRRPTEAEIEAMYRQDVAERREYA